MHSDNLSWALDSGASSSIVNPAQAFHNYGYDWSGVQHLAHGRGCTPCAIPAATRRRRAQERWFKLVTRATTAHHHRRLAAATGEIQREKLEEKKPGIPIWKRTLRLGAKTTGIGLRWTAWLAVRILTDLLKTEIGRTITKTATLTLVASLGVTGTLAPLWKLITSAFQGLSTEQVNNLFGLLHNFTNYE